MFVLLKTYHVPVVTAADYVSTMQEFPWMIPLQNSEFKLCQLNCLQGVWLASDDMI